MDKVTKLAKLMSDTLYTWSDEELLDLFLDSSISWEEGSNLYCNSIQHWPLCTRAEKIAYLEKQGFNIKELTGIQS